jgi:hypothetical protein
MLVEAKATVPHGGWLPWLTETGLTPRTAQRYMRLAGLPDDKYDTVSHLGLKGALDAIAEPGTIVGGEPDGFDLPKPGQAMQAVIDDAQGKHTVTIWPSKHPGYFHHLFIHESSAGNGPGMCMTDKRPITSAGLSEVIKSELHLAIEDLVWDIFDADLTALEKQRHWVFMAELPAVNPEEIDQVRARIEAYRLERGFTW